MAHSDDEPELYDSLLILTTGGGGAFFKNTKVTISGDISNRWDIKPSPGKDGAKETYRGYDAAKVKIAFELYTTAMVDAWLRILPAFRPKPSKTSPSPIELSHPTLDAYGLTKFNVEKIPLWSEKSPGIWEVKLELVEWFAQPKKVKPKVRKIPPLKPGEQGPPTAAEASSGFQHQEGPPAPPPPSASNSGPAGGAPVQHRTSKHRR